MPQELTKRAEMRIWIDFCYTQLQAAAGNIRHDHEVEKNKKRLRQHLETPEERMTGRSYIVDDYSLADITCLPFFTREITTGRPSPTTCPT